MSGSTRHERTPSPGNGRARALDATFEADLQCALASTTPVLITGPAELAARVAERIHHDGLYRRNVFLTVDCGATCRPEQLDTVFESAAPRGTIFLRDVDRLAPALQTLLFFRLAPYGVRVIAATSVSLLRAAATGAFDERLFYRLNQIHLMAGHPTPSGVA